MLQIGQQYRVFLYLYTTIVLCVYIHVYLYIVHIDHWQNAEELHQLVQNWQSKPYLFMCVFIYLFSYLLLKFILFIGYHVSTDIFQHVSEDDY